MEANFYLKARFKTPRDIRTWFTAIRQYMIDHAEELGIVSPEDTDNCYDCFNCGIVGHKDEFWYSCKMNHHGSLEKLAQALKERFGAVQADWMIDDEPSLFGLLNVRPRKKPCRRLHLSKKERATLLAALRFWQTNNTRELECGEFKGTGNFTEVDPLNNEEIDQLCERITFD